MVEQTIRPTVLLFDVNETLLELTPVQMSMHLVPAKIAMVVLAVIGALVLLSAFGMFFTHSAMMGGSTLHGLWFSIARMCRWVMGG